MKIKQFKIKFKIKSVKMSKENYRKCYIKFCSLGLLGLSMKDVNSPHIVAAVSVVTRHRPVT